MPAQKPQFYTLRFVAVFLYRGWLGLLALWTYKKRVLRWWVSSRETTNHTYHLSDLSRRYLEQFLSDATGATLSDVRRFMDELEADQDLAIHIRNGIKDSGWGYKADLDIRYGKRLGWYALVRILKPKVVIETGVDKGLGSVVLAAALKRNVSEGYPGRYFGTDINPRAGYLLSGSYADYGQILYGDSISSLQAFEQPIDLFINDSDHSADYEAQEYVAIAHKLAPNAVVAGDNCEVTDALCVFAEKSNKRFVFWREEPANHWFSGGGIGLMLPSSMKNMREG